MLQDNILEELPFPNHWVIYNGGLIQSNGNIQFSVYSWGNPYNVNVDEETFKDNFYGYVKCKI